MIGHLFLFKAVFMHIFLFLILISAVIIIFIGSTISKRRNKIFKIKKTENKLLIVPLVFNDRKYNFMLDTGSTASHICDDYYKEFEEDEHVCHNDIYGTGDKISCMTYIRPKFTFNNKYRKKNIRVPLIINNSLKSTFDMIRNDYGVLIHGVLGMDFIEKYISLISFKNTTLIIKDRK